MENVSIEIPKDLISAFVCEMRQLIRSSDYEIVFFYLTAQPFGDNKYIFNETVVHNTLEISGEDRVKFWTMACEWVKSINSHYNLKFHHLGDIVEIRDKK